MESKKPPFRKLRGYAFDPSLSLQMETAVINEVVYKVEWEALQSGPIGEYVQVLDYDPTTRDIYLPVDLNDTYILAADGLDPSESNPQFHQQMVYAVAMTTIKNFEMALGRRAMWNPRKLKTDTGYRKENVPLLRIYPHALREANAFYSPQKRSLLFGYFSADPGDTTLHMPGGLVFTCLTHDIVAHETTHALLDGMHSSYTTPTNPDVLAFHEAFADIVALFQHFTFPDVLKHQLAKTGGNLESQNLLGQLAQEFGKATGKYGSLRDAIGEIDPETKRWRLKRPDPAEYEHTMEPHARGSILVAAIFDAFLNIYRSRVADLLRIASGGTGVLPAGELHPDLVNRLATEASKSASHILRMCVRALDYCPTTDITFGDYLRAIITADVDLIADDAKDYRLAFIDAFRKRGIYPEGVRTLSVESLVYRAEDVESHLQTKLGFLAEYLREYRKNIYCVTDRKRIFEITNAFMGGGPLEGDYDSPGTTNVQGLHSRINTKFDDSREFELLTGLVFTDGWPDLGIRTSTADTFQAPSFEVRSLKLANRVGPQGKVINHIVLTLIQRCGVVCREDPEKPGEVRISTYVPGAATEIPDGGFEFSGSCTLIFDLDSLELKYIVSKPLLDVERLQSTGVKELSRDRILAQYRYLFGDIGRDEYTAYFSQSSDNSNNEPFAFLHRSF